MITFEWDASKALLNQKKHGVSFDEAKTVFSDEHAKVIHDPDHSEREERFVIVGLSFVSRVLVVAHCYRQSDTVVRIISARRATRKELSQYQEDSL